MDAELRTLFEDGFVMPALEGPSIVDVYPWLSLWDELSTRADCNLRYGRFAEFPGMQWQSLDILGCDCHGAGPNRPVTYVSYDLSDAMRLHEPAAFDELRARFDELLGTKGDYAEFEFHGGTPSSSVRARSQYQLDGVELTLSSIRAPRETRDYVLTAILSLHPSLERLAAPYLAGFEARDQLWSIGDASARVVTALELPQLEAYQTLSVRPLDPRAQLALYAPERRAPPQWLRERLAPHQVLHWTCAGYWGLATPDFTTLFADGERPAFHHMRLTPARSSGSASIGMTSRQSSIWQSRPSPDGLDALADYLRELGCELLVSELPAD